MPVDLTAVTMKLDRAREHIATLRNEIDGFMASDPPPMTVEFASREGDGGTLHFVGTAIIQRPPPREWSLIIGDAVQNTRGALEYLLQELLPAPQREGKHYFPIYTTSPFPKQARATLALLSDDHQTLLERLQPYHWPEPSRHPLAILSELSNQDKHRLLVTAETAVAQHDAWIGIDNADVEWTRFEAARPIKDGAVIVEFAATPTKRPEDMHVGPHAALQVSIDGRLDVSAVDLLGHLEHYARYDAVEMYFKDHYMPPDPATYL